jgi:ribonuclease BN (tRNA processing enzyme)
VCIERTIILKKSGEPDRTVTQFHFTSWPDHSKSSSEKILQLIDLVNAKYDATRNNKNVPIIVHCSAGCGRTGSYIVIDSVLDAIKNGKDWANARGKTIPNTELTEHPLAPKSYAYCSDTAYFENIIPIVSEVDLLYHEATFSNELYELAKQSGHSTATQAAEIAKAAKVKKLLLGHFSSRYKNPQILLDEAKSIFPNTLLANDGEVYSIE